MPHKVARIKGKGVQSHASISTLFRFFGVHPSPRNDAAAPKCYFRDLPVDQMEWYLADARKNYLAMLRKAHPDSGGTDAAAAEINGAWDQLLKRARYLHPNIEL